MERSISSRLVSDPRTNPSHNAVQDDRCLVRAASASLHTLAACTLAASFTALRPAAPRGRQPRPRRLRTTRNALLRLSPPLLLSCLDSP